MNTLRRHFLKWAAYGVAGALALGYPSQFAFAQEKTSPQSRPNILILFIDDLGWADVGYNGSTFYETPNIDRLAAQGMVFNKAYAASPLCSPTRASLLTGRNPARLHITSAIHPQAPHLYNKSAEDLGTAEPHRKLVAPGYRDHLPLEEVTFAEVLGDAGYQTGYIGKWHLGGEPYHPEDQGFAFNFGGSHYPFPPSYFYPYRIHVIEDGEPGEYITDRLTDEAEKFLDANRGSRFLLLLSHYGVHAPFEAKAEITAKYRAKDKPADGQKNPVYAAMIQSVDESVGRVLKKLDDLNLSDMRIPGQADRHSGTMPITIPG